MSTTGPDLKATMREKYGQAATGAGTACCGSDCCDPISADLYSDKQLEEVPSEALRASLGCGNPTALAELRSGQTVLDLGSGGGIDVLLSAKRVGPHGKVFGLDMTDEMLALARANAERANAHNVEFLKGDIEAIPLPDQSVDVVISNCVINLATDKDAVLREAFRVLRPGGAFAVSDVVVLAPVDDAIRRSVELWVGCVAGALDADDYRRRLAAAGFEGIEIEPWRIYDVSQASEFLTAAGIDPAVTARNAEGKFAS